MQTVTQLKLNQENSNKAIGKMTTLVNSLNAKVDAINKDASRSTQWKLDNIKTTREAALPAISAELKNVQSIAQVAASDEPFWQSKPLLLSLQHFDEDLGKDAVIRIATAAELKLVPLPMLGLVWENAKADKNMAMIYQCYLAGINRRDETGFSQSVNLALDSIEIPNQASALASISVCRTNRTVGENLFVEAAAMRSQSVSRMQVGREQQATSRMIQAAEAASATS